MSRVLPPVRAEAVRRVRARPAPARPARARRAGSVYLLVLATTTLVAVLGISGLMAARLERVGTTLGADAAAAGALAHAGLAAAAHRLGHDAAWAAAPGTGWTTPLTLGEGAYSIRVTEDAYRPGVHAVRVRAVVGRSVRVLQAKVREPPRLGPELLLNAEFEEGLFPSEGRGSDGVEITRVRTPQRVVAVEDRDDPGDGIQQELRTPLVPDATYRVSVRVRLPAGPDTVRVGLERETTFVGAATFAQGLGGESWAEVSAEVSPPLGSGGVERFFVRTENDKKKLQIDRISLRRVLAPVAGEALPGSFGWVADDDPPPGS